MFSAKPYLSLGQGNILRRATAQHILDFNRILRYAHDLVTPVYDVTFSRDEHVVTLGEKNLLGLARLVGKTEKLQVDGRWCLYRRWRVDSRLVVGHACCLRLRDILGLGDKNVTSRARVFRLLAAGEQIKTERGIKIVGRMAFLAGARARCTTRHRPSGQSGCARRSGRTRSGKIGRRRRRELIRDHGNGHHAEYNRPDRFLSIFRSQFHYAPTFKYVSTFTCNLIGPVCSPANVTLLMIKNMSSRSNALMKRARDT